MIREVPEELRAGYAVFRRSRRPPDELTTRHARAPQLSEAAYGLNPSLSRAARTSSGTVVMLVPGDGLLAELWDGGLSVGSIEQALGGESVGTSFRGTGRLQVFGVLPDGVDEVLVTRRSGKSVRLEVPDHAYEVEMVGATVHELPWRVEFRLGGHVRRLDIPGADPEVMIFRGPARR